MPSTVPTDVAHQTGPKVPTGIVPNVRRHLSRLRGTAETFGSIPKGGHRKGWWSLGDSNP